VIRIVLVLLRILGMFAIGALDSGAVALGLRWRGPDGRTHWKDSLR